MALSYPGGACKLRQGNRCKQARQISISSDLRGGIPFIGLTEIVVVGESVVDGMRFQSEQYEILKEQCRRNHGPFKRRTKILTLKNSPWYLDVFPYDVSTCEIRRSWSRWNGFNSTIRVRVSGI